MGADGQANVTIDGLADLGLTSADGTPLSQIVVHLTLDEAADIIARAEGVLGSNRQYLEQLVRQLEHLGISDDYLLQLLDQMGNLSLAALPCQSGLLHLIA